MKAWNKIKAFRESGVVGDPAASVPAEIAAVGNDNPKMSRYAVRRILDEEAQRKEKHRFFRRWNWLAQLLHRAARKIEPTWRDGPTWTVAAHMLRLRTEKLDAHPMKIDWHAAAVLLAQRWLAKQEEENTKLETVGRVEGPVASSIIDRVLMEVGHVEVTWPFVIMLWQGREPNACGMQIIGKFVDDE